MRFSLAFQNYASILYLRIPPGFRIILRGKDIEHHNLVNDMMLAKEITYRPVPITDANGMPKDSNVTLQQLSIVQMSNFDTSQMADRRCAFFTDLCCRDSWVCKRCEVSY